MRNQSFLLKILVFVADDLHAIENSLEPLVQGSFTGEKRKFRNSPTQPGAWKRARTHLQKWQTKQIQKYSTNVRALMMYVVVGFHFS